MAESRPLTRIAFAVLVLGPFGTAACDLLKSKAADAGAEQPAATATAVAPTTTAAAPQETTTPLVPATAPAHVPTKVVKLADGGTATIPVTGFDAAAFPNLGAFDAAAVPPLTVPGFDASALPKTLPTTLPSGFPTALPGWPPPASTAK